MKYLGKGGLGTETHKHGLESKAGVLFVAQRKLRTLGRQGALRSDEFRHRAGNSHTDRAIHRLE